MEDRRTVEISYLSLDHLRSQEESVSRYWQVTERNRYGLTRVGLRGSTGVKKVRSTFKFCEVLRERTYVEWEGG